MLRAISTPLALAMAALAIVLAGLETWRPGFFLHDDNATWFAPAYAHDFRVLTQTGRLAEINFYQYGGEPFLEQGQTAVLYPPVYLGCALANLFPGDLRWSIEWTAALHLALGLGGFYAWRRQNDAAAGLAALGGLAWALNPFVLLLGASWVTVTFAAAWLPWLFWSLERTALRATLANALILAGIATLFVLQGYVQWAAYAFLFAALDACWLVYVASRGTRVMVLLHFFVAGLITLALTLPLLLPMMAAVGASAARAQPLSLGQALAYRAQPGDLFDAQLGIFRPGFMFGLSTAIFFCPALLLAPVPVLRFLFAAGHARGRLFPLIIFSVLALICSGVGHVLLDAVPLMQRFRWPFKMFLLADFFLVAALVQGLATFPRRWGKVSVGTMILVSAAQVGVVLWQHDGNFISKTTLPGSGSPFPAAIDPARGRVIAVDDALPELDSWRFATHLYATYDEVPSLGGYDPLVSRDRLGFALGLDFPNVFTRPITADVRAALEARAVRYWIVDPASSRRAEIEKLDQLRLVDAAPDRLIYEDLRARPLARADSAPDVPLPLTYAGNSLRIDLPGADTRVAVSLGPTDGWWYRLNGGGWQRAVYQDDQIAAPVAARDHELEIAYFDPRFRHGLWLGLLLLAAVAAGLALTRFISRGKSRAASP